MSLVPISAGAWISIAPLQLEDREEAILQTSNEQPTRTVAFPTTIMPVVRRRSPWPFPAGGMRRKTDNMSATANAVIETTTRAFFAEGSGSTPVSR